MADNRDTFTSEIYVNNEQANDAIAEMTKQLTKLTDKYDDLASKNEKLKEKTDKAKSAMEETRKALEGMTKDTDEYAKTSKKLDQQTKAYNNLAKQVEVSNKKTAAAEKEMNSMKESIARAEKGTEAFRKAIDNLSGKSMNNLVRMQSQLKKELDKTKPNTKEWDELAKKYAEVTKRIEGLKAAQQSMIIRQDGLFKRMANGLSNYFGAIMIGYQAVKRVVSGLMDAYKVISNFEQANANLASILGATSDQMEVLEKSAISLGSSTRYSASQVTGLQTELAKLGFTVKEITDMAPAVLNFAGSVGTDLGSAAALAGVALRSFNLRSDQTEDALGTMAVACNKSALSFTYLQNSFSTIAPVAKTYGLSLKDTIALLGTLANAGFDASSAATATRNILLNLSDTNGKLAKALGGSVHSFEDIMDAMKKLRDQGVDLNKTLELTDKRSVAAFNTFLDGAESAQTLRGELEDVNGELQRMAEQRANTVEGAIDGMKSAWEGLVLSFRSSTGTFASVFKFITQGINGIRDMIDPEGSIVERTAKNYAEVFRGMGNEFISVYETQERIQKRFEEMNKAIDAGGGTARYKRYAKEGLQKAYDEVMSELESQAETANAKVLELNTKFMNEEQKILKQQAKLTENGLNASNMAAYNKLQEQLEANRKAWDQAIDDATRFKEKMDDIVSGGDTKGGSGNGGGGGLTDKELAKQQQAYNKKKAMLDAALNYEEKRLKVAWLKGETGEAEYNSAVYQAKAQYYQDLLALAQQYSQDNTAIRNKMLDDHIKALEAEKKRVKEEMEEMAKYYSDLEKQEEDRFGSNNPNRGKSNEELEADAFAPKNDFQAAIWKKAAEIRAAITEDSARTEYETQMKWIEKLHKDGLLSDEEFEKVKLDQKLGFAAKIAQEVNRYAEMASNFANALKESETAKMEAEYQAQLTAAGDNAERREQIDAEYEQKKLDLQKKYADVDMAINIAKTVANGAAAVVKAHADPGGVAGWVLAGLIAASTAAEVATIIAQRNAIKATSVGGGGSSSVPKTGERKMTGYSEGGNTPWAASDKTPVGIVHANEYVIPAWMKRKNPVLIANLERYRRAGSHGRTGSARHGFADGGFTSTTSGGIASGMAGMGDIEAAVEAAIRRTMADGAIRAFLVRNDLTELDNQTQRFKNQTSR